MWGIGPKRVVQHGQLMLNALAPFRKPLLESRPWGKRQPETFPSPPSPSPPSPSPPSLTPAFTSTATAPGLSRRSARAAGRDARQGSGGGSGRAVRWDEAAGLELASHEWQAQADSLPACDWALRRRRCARVHGCEACARYVGDGRDWSYASMSQRVLDMLSSPAAYGSHHAAHAAGWRWNASPNHGQSSHAHQWWPPQEAVDRLLPAATRLPLGTYKALALIDELF